MVFPFNVHTINAVAIDILTVEFKIATFIDDMYVNFIFFLKSWKNQKIIEYLAINWIQNNFSHSDNSDKWGQVRQ